MKEMKLPSVIRSALVLLISLFFLGADASLTKQRAVLGRTLTSSAADTNGEPEGKKEDKTVSKDDAEKGDDEDDDDDDDDEDDKEDTEKSSEAKPAAKAKAEVVEDPHAKERAALQKAVEESEKELAANLAQQKQLKHNIDDLEDLSSSNHEIDASAKLVSKETESAAMGSMLAKMWKDMRMFEIPGYAKHAQEEIRHLRHKEQRIEDEITAAQAEVSAAKRKWATEGSTNERTKKERGEEKVALAKKGGGGDEDEDPVPAPAKAIHEDVHAGVKHAEDKTVEAAVLHRWSVWQMDGKQQKSVFLSSLVYLLFGVLLAFAYKKARFKPNQPFQPTPRLGLQNHQQKDFSFSLFGCFGDYNVCVVGCCCPCLRWADTVDRKQLLPYWQAFWIMFVLMLLHVYTLGFSTIIACFVGIHYRQRLRKKYGFDSGTLLTLAGDAMAWFCCQPCAIIQEAREEAAHDEP